MLSKIPFLTPSGTEHTHRNREIREVQEVASKSEEKRDKHFPLLLNDNSIRKLFATPS